mmetsp:Transcript_100697/g.244867  ORF Transcript_100697/g.244867 Transcript_100697/m.244867 type:complete len:499 (-) Transcript_100697:99-1595(-)
MVPRAFRQSSCAPSDDAQHTAAATERWGPRQGLLGHESSDQQLTWAAEDNGEDAEPWQEQGIGEQLFVGEEDCGGRQWLAQEAWQQAWPESREGLPRRSPPALAPRRISRQLMQWQTERKQEEARQCTFQPDLSLTSRPTRPGGATPSPAGARSRRRSEELAQWQRERAEREHRECTFRPDLSKGAKGPRRRPEAEPPEGPESSRRCASFDKTARRPWGSVSAAGATAGGGSATSASPQPRAATSPSKGRPPPWQPEEEDQQATRRPCRTRSQSPAAPVLYAGSAGEAQTRGLAPRTSVWKRRTGSRAELGGHTSFDDPAPTFRGTGPSDFRGPAPNAHSFGGRDWASESEHSEWWDGASGGAEPEVPWPGCWDASAASGDYAAPVVAAAMRELHGAEPDLEAQLAALGRLSGVATELLPASQPPHTAAERRVMERRGRTSWAATSSAGASPARPLPASAWPGAARAGSCAGMVPSAGEAEGRRSIRRSSSVGRRQWR